MIGRPPDSDDLPLLMIPVITHPLGHPQLRTHPSLVLSRLAQFTVRLRAVIAEPVSQAGACASSSPVAIGNASAVGDVTAASTLEGRSRPQVVRNGCRA
jgi:hypothetical protein